MAQRSLPAETEQLRQQASRLKADLDETLKLIEDVSGQLTNLAQEARQVASVLGPMPAGSRFSWGLLLTLGLGAGIVWLISPGTFEMARKLVASQLQKVTGGSRSTAS